jgi:hypothetical protein
VLKRVGRDNFIRYYCAMDPGWNAVVYTSLVDALTNCAATNSEAVATIARCSHPLAHFFERSRDGRVIAVDTDSPGLAAHLYVYWVEDADVCSLLDGVVIDGAANVTAILHTLPPVTAHLTVHGGRYAGFLLNEGGMEARYEAYASPTRAVDSIPWEAITSLSTDKEAYAWDYPSLAGIMAPFQMPGWSQKHVVSMTERCCECVVLPKAPASRFSQVEARSLLRIFPSALAVANVHLKAFESCILTHIEDDAGVIPSWLLNDMGFGIGPCCYALPSMTPWFPLLKSECGVQTTNIFLGRRPIGTVRFIGTVLGTQVANAYRGALDNGGACVFNGAPVRRGGAPEDLTIQLGSVDTGVEKLQLLTGVAVDVPPWVAKFRFLAVPEVGEQRQLDTAAE